MFHVSKIATTTNHSSAITTAAMELQPSAIHPLLASTQSDIESKAQLMRLLHENDDTILNQRTSAGAVPLHTAAAHGKTSCIDAILRNLVPIDSIDQDHRTPLFAAIAGDHTEAALLLIDHGANCCLKDRAKQSLLNLAIATQNETVVDALVKKGVPIELADIELAKKLGLCKTAKLLSRSRVFHAIYSVISEYITNIGAYRITPHILFEYFQNIFSQIGVKVFLDAPSLAEHSMSLDESCYIGATNLCDPIRQTIRTLSFEDQMTGREEFRTFLENEVKASDKENHIPKTLLMAMDRTIPLQFFRPTIDIVMEPLEVEEFEMQEFHTSSQSNTVLTPEETQTSIFEHFSERPSP